jgi:iron(III) transport system substrate-binding protein
VRRIVAVVVLAALGLALAACGGGDEDALTIYSGRTESLVAPLLDRFSEETGIPIEVRYGDTADLALLLAEEGDRTPADVFYSQSPGATAFLGGKRLLAPLARAELDLVDPRFEAEDGTWIGVSGRQRVLVYNEDLVEAADLPASVFDLTEPEFRGRVALAPENGSFQDFVTAMRQLRGEDTARDWLQAMAANASPVYANNTAIVEAVGRGEVPMGLVNHYYNYRALAEDPDLPSRNHMFRAGDLGGLVIPSTVSITASTERREQAERLVRFLLDEEAQTYFADETFEYPLAAGVRAAEDVPPLASLRPPRYDAGQLADLEATARLIAESGLGG